MKITYPVSRRAARAKAHARLGEFNTYRFTISGVYDSGTEALFFLSSQGEAERLCRWLSANTEQREYVLIDNQNGEDQEEWKNQTIPAASERQPAPRNETRSLKPSLRQRKDWEKAMEPERPPTLWDNL